MTDLYIYEKNTVGHAIGYIFFFLIIALTSQFVVGLFLFGFDLGFLTPLIGPFTATRSLFGLPANIMVIAVYLIGAVWIFMSASRKFTLTISTDNTHLIKTLKKGNATKENKYVIADISYISTKSVTTVSTSPHTSGSTTTYSTRISTVHALSLVYEGAKFRQEVLFRHKDPTVIDYLAKQITSNTKLQLG